MRAASCILKASLVSLQLPLYFLLPNSMSFFGFFQFSVRSASFLSTSTCIFSIEPHLFSVALKFICSIYLKFIFVVDFMKFIECDPQIVPEKRAPKFFIPRKELFFGQSSFVRMLFILYRHYFDGLGSGASDNNVLRIKRSMRNYGCACVWRNRNRC